MPPPQKGGGFSMKQPKTYYDLKSCPSSVRISCHVGGTRSGKTYSILQALCELCYLNKNLGLTIDVVRKTFPSLRATVLRDFKDILMDAGWYDEANHNKSENTYELFGNTWSFYSVDMPQKIRGRSRSILYCNEVNELSLEDWLQLSFRTRDKIICDFNPSEVFHWLWQKVIPREDCRLYRSTYRDNPHLPQSLIDEIEMLQDSDPEYWRIYGEGQRATNRRAIYMAAKSEVPPQAKLVGYGLDWGYSQDPTAMVAVHKLDNALYVEELMYEKGLTNDQIAKRIQGMGVGKNPIIADSAEPKSIAELRRYGLNVRPAEKGPDSVRNGIDLLRRHQLHYTGENLEREFHMYRWKTNRNGDILSVPQDENDHLMDAARYCCLNLLMPKYTGKYHIA